MANRLDEIIEPAVVALGYDYVGCESTQDGRGQILRVYVDGPKGVTIEACADLSHQIGAALDVADPFKQSYRLEVSSPGLNRPLFKLPHFKAVVGKSIRCRLHTPQDGRRNFKGVLSAVDGETLHLIVDGQSFALNYHDIDKANLVFDF